MASETLVDVQHSRSMWLESLLLAVVSLALTLYCLELIKNSGQISSLWFSTTLMTVVVFRSSRYTLLPRLSGCVLGVILANSFVNGPGLAALLFPLYNLAQALAGGLLLRLLLDRQAPLNSLYSWVKMMLAVALVTPLAGALLASRLFETHYSSLGQFFTTWVASEVVGMLALGPVAMLWQRDSLLKKRLLVETLLTLLVTLCLSWLALRYLPWSLAFVIVILFYSAVRLPRLAAFIVYLATVAMISLMQALRLIPLEADTSYLYHTLPWLPFMLALIPSHLMTLVMHSFREERKRISESESRFRHAMEYSAIGMALVSPDGRWLQVNDSLCRLLGYKQEELKKLTFQAISYPGDLHSDLAQMNALLAGETNSYTLEKRYLHRDGHIVWALLAVSLVRDSERNPLYFISQIEDITELKRTEEENRRLMERITLANDAGGIGVWEWDMITDKLSWDRRMYLLYALPVHALVTTDIWAKTLYSADHDKTVATFIHAIKTRSAIDIEFRIETSLGLRIIRCQANLLTDERGTPARLLGICQDVSDFRLLTQALDEEKERMHITLDAIDEAVISTDREMQIIFMNPVAEKMTGWLQRHAVGKPITEILRITQGGDGPGQEIVLSCALPKDQKTGLSDEDLVLHNRAGKQFAIKYSLSPLSTPQGESIGSVMVIQDVSVTREIFKRLSYSASHDMLTHLPNRPRFEQQLTMLVSGHDNDGRGHVLTFLDLDRFKAVNDSAGHAAGDALLRELSGVMMRQLPDDGFLARLGGDEFGLLLPDCTLEDAARIASRLVSAISEYDFLWNGKSYRVGASAGLTGFNGDSISTVEVMAQADLACYHAKNNGRGQISIYGNSTLRSY